MIAQAEIPDVPTDIVNKLLTLPPWAFLVAFGMLLLAIVAIARMRYKVKSPGTDEAIDRTGHTTEEFVQMTAGLKVEVDNIKERQNKQGEQIQAVDDKHDQKAQDIRDKVIRLEAKDGD